MSGRHEREAPTGKANTADATAAHGEAQSEEGAPPTDSVPADSTPADSAFADLAPTNDAPPADGIAPAAETSSADDAARADESADLATDVALTDREARANEAAERMRPSRRAAAKRWGIRIAAGVAAIGLVAAAMMSAGALPADVSYSNTASDITLQPEAPTRQRACAGGAVQLGTADGENALAVQTIASPQVEDGSDSSSKTSISSHEIFERVGNGDAASLAQTLRVEVSSDEGAGARASAGFAASECAEPSLDQWLVGGSTRTGRQSVVTIVNPGTTAASVDITVFGAEGEVAAVGSSGVAVAAGEVEVIDLAAIAPAVSEPVVRVAATGAPVTAHLQQTTTRGLEAGGYDIVDPVPALSSAYISGLEIEEPSPTAAVEDFDDAAPVVRLLSPTGGAVTMQVRTSEGDVTSIDGVLKPGVVADYPLDDVQPGVVSVRVEAATPVVAGARALAGDPGLDFDWIAGGQPLSGAVRVAVPEGPSPTLFVVNAAPAPAQVTIDGETVEIPGDGSVGREVDPGSVDVDGENVVIAVRYRGDDVAGGYTVSPDGPAATGLRVVR